MPRKFALLALVLLSVSAHADDWNHLSFNTNQGIRVGVDYQSDRSRSGITYASPFYVNAKSSNFSGAEKVRAVITQECSSPHFYERVSFVLDLDWQGNHFSAEFADAKLLMNDSEIDRGSYQKLRIWSAGGGYGENCKHELALVSNGQWQRFGNDDSVSFLLQQ